jgi:hypothetical protein
MNKFSVMSESVVSLTNKSVKLKYMIVLRNCNQGL